VQVLQGGYKCYIPWTADAGGEQDVVQYARWTPNALYADWLEINLRAGTPLMDHPRMLLRLIILYAVASLLHFIHNALYIQAYPNLPSWVTPLGVFGSWCGIAAIGALGYWLYQKVSRIIGLLVIALYALLGFGGLDHYAIAPIHAHTVAMNLTIFGEVAAASMLLIFVAYSSLRGRRQV
jgi:hypothetical protein